MKPCKTCRNYTIDEFGYCPVCSGEKIDQSYFMIDKHKIYYNYSDGKKRPSGPSNPENIVDKINHGKRNGKIWLTYWSPDMDVLGVWSLDPFPKYEDVWV